MSESAYRANPAVRLHWVSWDDEYVAFDETSGQTHLMDPARSLVLNLVGERVLSFASILEGLALAPELGNRTDLPQWLTAVLGELEATGLVEAARR